MSTPPEQPYIYPHPQDEQPVPERKRRPASRLPRRLLMLIALGVLFLAGLIVYLRVPASEPISVRDISATAEAQSFATSQVYRESTRVSSTRTSIAAARSTSTAEAIAAATQQAYAYRTATAAAQATAQAPPTLTAQALRFEQEQAQANATAQAMEHSATLVYGPADGTLAHTVTKQVPCEQGPPDQLSNFIVEARFYNPYPATQNAWDYGFGITNPADQYVVAIDSESGRFFSLQAPGYTIQYRNTTSAIDLSEASTNLLKVYVQDEIAHLYVNNQYVASQDLSDISMAIVRPSSDTHGLQVCTGFREDDMLPGASTRFEGFTVWRVP